ncbi:hypothetical protein [Succinimonas sp.]|uniref:hypothetical protein n=1 Tax=Succinimonas sp. TaxID=1936151 RepID=UPI00386D881E
MSGPKDSRISLEERRRRELERKRREELERKRREEERKRLMEEARKKRVRDLKDSINSSSRGLEVALNAGREQIQGLKEKIEEFGIAPTQEYRKFTGDVEAVAQEIVAARSRDRNTENEQTLKDILADFQKVADRFRVVMDGVPRVAKSISAAYTEKLTSEIADLSKQLAEEERQRREKEQQEKIRKAAEEEQKRQEKLHEARKAAEEEIARMEESFRKTVCGRVATSQIQDEIDALENALHAAEKGNHNAEYLRSFAAISLEPRLKELNRKLTDYENLREEYGALSDEYLAICREAGVPPKTFPVTRSSLTFLKAEIDVIHQTLAKRDAERYISAAINEVMAEMGYRLIGGLKARPDGIVKSGLYRFNEEAAVSVTYDSNGDMCMELGALDTEDRDPDPAESERLRQDMESFCSGYRKIREKLAEKGLVLNRGSELPPDAEYAQVFNISDYECAREDIQEVENARRIVRTAPASAQQQMHLPQEGS